jgi:hypothetical protein
MGGEVILKRNELNRITPYRNITQLKIFSKILYLAKIDPSAIEYTLDIKKDIIEDFQANKKNYTYLKNICRTMSMIDI